MHGTRRIAAVSGDGTIVLVEEAIPEVKPGWVLIEVARSLVSPGTELGGWRGLKAMTEKPLSGTEPRKFGYSNAGRVVEIGEGVTTVKPGDRISAVGAGYALHTDYALVPHNLCFRLPDNVSFSQGSYGMLAATALHTLRRCEPEFGEYSCVVGLGIVGQLSAMLLQLAGNYVIGWDTIPQRLEIAKQWGIHRAASAGSDAVIEETAEFTNGAGLDSAVIAFGGDADKAYQQLEKSFKISPDTHRMGRLVVVGGATFTYPSGTTNLDIRRASRTGAGYHDEKWEVGPDYPPVFMRWTTRTNVNLCLRLISEGKLPVDGLTTHTIPIAEITEGIGSALADPDGMLGVIFEIDR